MMIYALEQNRNAVNQKLALIRHLNLPHSDLLRDVFTSVLYDRGIEIRFFGVPQNRGCQIRLRAVRVKEHKLTLAVILNFFIVREYFYIADVTFITRKQVYIAEDSRHTEEILVFEIAAGAPLSDFYTYCVFARHEIVAYLKFGRKV